MASKQPAGAEGVAQGVSKLDLSKDEKKRIHSDLAFVIQRKLLDTDFENLQDHLLCRGIVKENETYKKFIHLWMKLEKQKQLAVGKYDFLKDELTIIGRPDLLEIIQDFEDEINGVSPGQSQKWLKPGRSDPAGSSESKPSGGGNIQGIQAQTVTFHQTFNIPESREEEESQSESDESPARSTVSDVRPKEPTGNAAPGAAWSSKARGTHLTTEDECIRLVAAAYRGDLDTVIRLLNEGVSVNQPRPEDQSTAIIQAAFEGHLPVVIELLRRGAEVDSQDKDGNTAFIASAQVGYLDSVQLLLDKGADINHRSKVQETAIWRAALNGRLSVVKELVKQGADVNSQKEDGFTAFMAAAQEGHLHCVQLLFDKGADINHSSKNEVTALHNAARNGHLDVTKYLVQNGAEVDARDKWGDRPVDDARKQGHKEVENYLNGVK